MAQTRVAAKPEPPEVTIPMVERKMKPPLLWQIEFSDMEEAQSAVRELDGTIFDNDQPIRVTVNPTSRDATEVQVQGIHSRYRVLQVAEHFEQVGTIKKIKSFPLVKFGEVRFKTADEAWLARTDLDGTELMGLKLRVELDCSGDFLNKVLVHGLGPNVMWQELKDYFRKAGEITFAAVHGDHCRTAKVRYSKIGSATRAMNHLNRKKMNERDPFPLHVCRPWDGSEVSTEVRVKGLPDHATESELSAFFSEVGKVEEVEICGDPLPAEFCEPV